MSDSVIRVENLSKKYIIGYQKQERYTSLRDVISDKVRGIGNIFNRNAKQEDSAFEDFWALKDISFEIKQGERVGIIGRNGAGKSTLLKILSRITEPTSGKISIKGRVASLLEVGTGFHPELTGRENVYLNGAILGMSEAEIRKKFDEIVTFAEVEKFLDTPVKHYSSGMYVRLAFAVAAHLESEILVIDEVLAVGDSAFQKKCLGKMGDVATQEGRTVLFVSHNMTTIKSLCRESIWLDSGIIAMYEPTIKVINSYLHNADLDKESSQVFAIDNHKIAQVRFVQVIDYQGNPNSLIDLNQKFTLKIDYDIKKTMSRLSLGCQIICGENNECLISLSDSELEISLYELDRQSGYYQTEIEIPKKLLNTGYYYLRIGIVQHPGTILDVVEQVSFTIVDNFGVVRHLGYDRKNSLLSVQLPWDIKQFSSN